MHLTLSFAKWWPFCLSLEMSTSSNFSPFFQEASTWLRMPSRSSLQTASLWASAVSGSPASVIWITWPHCPHLTSPTIPCPCCRALACCSVWRCSTWRATLWALVRDWSLWNNWRNSHWKTTVSLLEKLHQPYWWAISHGRIHFQIHYYNNCLVQDCSISSVLAMEILQSCTKPSILSPLRAKGIVMVNAVHLSIHPFVLKPFTPLVD